MDFENPTPPSENSESGATMAEIDYSAVEMRMIARQVEQRPTAFDPALSAPYCGGVVSDPAAFLAKLRQAWSAELASSLSGFITKCAENEKTVRVGIKDCISANLKEYQKQYIEFLLERFRMISDRQAVLGTASKRIAQGYGRLGTYLYLRTLHVEKRLAKWAARKAYAIWVQDCKDLKMDFRPDGPLKNPNIVVEDLAY